MIDHITKLTDKRGNTHYWVRYSSGRCRSYDPRIFTKEMREVIESGRVETKYEDIGKIETFYK